MSKHFCRSLVILLSTAVLTRADDLTKDQLDKLRALFQEARTQYMQGEFAKSNESYAKILDALPVPKNGPHDPNRARVHYDMGCNLSRLGKKKEACEALGRAVEKGFWNHQYLTSDPTLKDLHEENEFKAVVEKAKGGLSGMAFGLKDLNGKSIERKDYEGKVLILDIWGTWCPPCRQEIPHFVKLQEKYGDKGLRIVGLTWERRPPDDQVKKQVEAFAAREKINYPLTLITQEILGSIPEMGGFPTTFFIDRQGQVAERVTGALPYQEIERRAKKLLDARAPAPKPAADAG
ncbi:MAG TPA: TlpA disulfide reductase family protein [Planctomycetota bacterium]|nr:TlpA disulfide reductase family protein [Planctomycetota bacterium]